MAKVLLVEQNDKIAKIYRGKLLEDGHIIEIAKNLQEAMLIYENALLSHSRSFDLIITALLPKGAGSDGINLIYKIREKDKLTPIILHAGPQTRVRQFEPEMKVWIVVKHSQNTALTRTMHQILKPNG